MAASTTERGQCWFHIANAWSTAPFPPTRQIIFNPAFTATMDRAWDRWWSDATRLATSFSRCNPMWFLVHKSQQDAQVTVYFCLTTALHVTDFIITHLQKHKTTVTTASGNRYTVLMSAAIVEELQLFHDSSRQQYDVTVTRWCSYNCFVLLKMGDGDIRNM